MGFWSRLLVGSSNPGLTADAVPATYQTTAGPSGAPPVLSVVPVLLNHEHARSIAHATSVDDPGYLQKNAALYAASILQSVPVGVPEWTDDTADRAFEKVSQSVLNSGDLPAAVYVWDWLLAYHAKNPPKTLGTAYVLANAAMAATDSHDRVAAVKLLPAMEAALAWVVGLSDSISEDFPGRLGSVRALTGS